MSNYYNAAEIAAQLTGYIEANITYHITQRNYAEAKRLNKLLIDVYSAGGWGEICERWLADYKEQRDIINTLIHESTSTKRDQGLTEVW